MQHHDGSRRLEGMSSSHHENRDERRRVPADSGSPRRSGKSYVEERKFQTSSITPHSTPDRYRKTPQSTGTVIKADHHSEERSKRKDEYTPLTSSPEKTRRKSQSSSFVNTLIGQWMKHSGSRLPYSQSDLESGSPTKEAGNSAANSKEPVVRVLQRKLEQAQDTISELYSSRNTELKVKDEILAKINENWQSMEVINKFSEYMRECLTEFQQQYASLSALYNDIITPQQLAIKKLQKELTDIKLKDHEKEKATEEMEMKIKYQEEKIQKMNFATDELRKEFKSAENKWHLEKKHLENLHAEEKLKLTKDREQFAIVKEELQSKLKQEHSEKENVIRKHMEDENTIKNFKENISDYKKQIEILSREKNEWNKKFEASAANESRLTEELQLKIKEMTNLEQNLKERQKIESELAKDVEVIGGKYDQQVQQYKVLEGNYKSLLTKFEEMQSQNTDLENVTNNLKKNSNNEIKHLKEEIKRLETENDKLLTEKRKKIRNLEDSHEALQKAHEAQICKMKTDFHNRLSESENTISQLYENLGKLKDRLKKTNDENDALQNKFSKLRETAEELRMKMINIPETITEKKSNTQQLKDKSDDTEQLSKSKPTFTMNDRKDSLRNTQSSDKSESTKSGNDKNSMSITKSAYVTRRSQNSTTANEDESEKMPRSQGTPRSKKVRFTLISPFKDTQERNVSTYSPRKEITPISSELKTGEDISPKYKFFKSRIASVKQYGTPRRGRGKK